MKHKTAELEGKALDAAVAMVEGVTGLVERSGRLCHEREFDPEAHSWDFDLKAFKMWMDYAPSQRWDQGGPIIERERIWLTAFPDGGWGADIAGQPGNPDVNPNPKLGEPGHVKAVGTGPTPLIAAMRAFAAATLGDEVEIPG